MKCQGSRVYKIHNTGGSNTRGDHSEDHAKTWYCGEGKGSQLGSREHKPKLRKSHAERGTERTEGSRGRFAEARQRNTARPRGTWYGVTTGTYAVKLGTEPEEEEEAQSGKGNLWWKAVDTYGREGGNSSAKHLIQKDTGPYAIERQGDRTGYASEGGVPRHKKTEEYTRRTAGNDQSQTGGRQQKRLKEKTYVILGTMNHRGSHAQVQRLN